MRIPNPHSYNKRANNHPFVPIQVNKSMITIYCLNQTILTFPHELVD